MIDFTIEKELADLGNNKRLRLISWGGRSAKLDIRNWLEDGERPGKGIALSDVEARALLDALDDYLHGNETH